MKNLLLALRFVFVALSVLFVLAIIMTTYTYISNGGEAGNITISMIVEMLVLLVVFIALSAVFSSVYDRRGYNDDRVVRREDLR